MIFSRQTSILAFLVLTVVLTGSCQNETGKINKQTIDSTVEKLRISRQHFWDSLPLPAGYVNDYEDLYTDSEEVILDSIIADFERRTTKQVAIITFDTTRATSDNLDALTLKIAKKWGVGQKEKNNGIVIGISRSYRKMRIQNGYGIEKILTDNETKEIIDNFFIPGFKKGNYFEGTLNGLNALIRKLRAIPVNSKNEPGVKF